jgi:hypothetical protein
MKIKIKILMVGWLAATLASANQLEKGHTYTDVGPGKTVTSQNLNDHVDLAVLLNGAILDQEAKTTTVETDSVLLGDSAIASDGAPKRVTLDNLLPEPERLNVPQYVATDTGVANAYVVSYTPVIAAYHAGMVIRFLAANTNSGASTLNCTSLGTTKTIKARSGADLAANDILAGQVVELVYDGTYFQILTIPQPLVFPDPYGYTTASNLAVGMLASNGLTNGVGTVMKFTSATAGVTNGSKILDTAHGLPGTPSLVRAVMVCQTATLGYTVGDEVDVAAVGLDVAHSSASAQYFTFGANSTNVYVTTCFGITAGLANKTSGVVTVTTNSLWRVKVYAWY